MADYSTTMGILQPQVGKSGDILLKFEHKNGGERGIRTLGDLRLGGFQDRCLKPLDHLSVCKSLNILASGKNASQFIIFSHEKRAPESPIAFFM